LTIQYKKNYNFFLFSGLFSNNF